MLLEPGAFPTGPASQKSTLLRGSTLKQLVVLRLLQKLRATGSRTGTSDRQVLIREIDKQGAQ